MRTPGAPGTRRERRRAAASEIAPGHVLRRLLPEDRRVAFPRRDVDQPGSRAERRRVPVGAALIARPRRLPRRLWRRDRPPFVVEAARPVHLDERRAGEEAAVGAVEHVEEAVAIGPEHRLRRRAAPVEIGEDGDLHRVVVVGVVRRELEVPLQLPGIGVERDDRVGIEVVARPLIGVPVGARDCRRPSTSG